MKYYAYCAIALGIFIIDRATKLAALAWCSEHAYKVNSFLSFDVVFNRGISWSMLNFSSNIGFIVVSLMIAMVTVAVCWHAYYNYARGVSIIAETLIIAGSISNLIDRVIYSGVVDFILLSYGNLSWPVFNVADAAIVMGVGLLLFRYEK